MKRLLWIAMGVLAWTVTAAEPPAAVTATPTGVPVLQGSPGRPGRTRARHRDLNELRADIAAEKIPLAEELAKWEDQLIQARRRLDQTQRAADSSAIEMAGLKSEQKSREDELSYIGNLLDEYIRNCETKTSVSELQR